MDKLSKIIELLNQQITSNYWIAKDIIDDYYEWWTEKNKEMLTLISFGDEDFTSDFAPYLRHHKTNDKVYIYWVTWPKRRRNEKTYPKKVKEIKGRGYTHKLLTKRCQDWQLERVLETENELSQIRREIDVLHTAKVAINKLIKE